MQKSFAALALVAAVQAIDTTTFAFMQYLSAQGKSYATVQEFNLRMELFAERDQIIKEWNARTDVTSKMGHNFLSDWTAEERKKLNGINYENRQIEHNVPYHQVTSWESNQSALNTVNWCSSTVNKCTPIKNQGSCGSCWAFSATETVESSIAISNNSTPVAYSPQQLVSCSSAYGNGGCNGGWYYYAWNYMQTYAQETETSYPYSNASYSWGITPACQYNAALGVVKTNSPTDYIKVGQTNTEIMSAIDVKPVSVAIDASQPVFQQYTSGVITDAAACGTSIDHAVVAVGYGTDSTGGNYFLVRNSWGTSWGNQGFVMIGQSTTGTAPGICAINTDVYYPMATLV